MKNGQQIPWSSRVTCCKDCIAPKRYIGCHDACEEYKKEKADNEAQKQKEKEARKKMGHVMGKHDFDMLSCMHRPRKDKRRK